MRTLISSLAAALAACLLLVAPAGAAGTTRDVLVVSNNWDGTADFVDPHTFEKLAHLNIIPDIDERMAEIMVDPPRLGYFLGVRELVGEGHDQFVDDSFTSHDGRYLYVSRPSLADVAAFDLTTDKIVWRTRVDGYRADHMAISPDGTRLLVSASTAAVVDEIDTADGKITRTFESGDQPHENNYSRDGKLIYHASIGTVFTPGDDPALDAAKGKRYFQVVDNATFEILKRIDMGKKLAEAGYPNMSSAVRPMALSPDERYVYFQVSFFHGFVEYDLKEDRVLRVANLPLSEKAKNTPREQYLLDSAHHGLAMNPEGTKLCAAGTMSDYAAIVHRDDFSYKIAAEGEKPYWSTNSGDGKYCFISFSGNDAVSVVSYADEKEIARIPVGDHPQRMRMGEVQVGALGIPAVKPAQCVDRRKFSFKLHHRPGVRIVKVAVYVNGKLKLRRSGRNIRRVTIKRLPKRKFKVRIVATHSTGARRISVRTYRGCTKSRPSTTRG
jgi:DNA-binding beta-propeller fold protein YncE